MPKYTRAHQSALTWASEIWGPDGIAVRAKDGRYLVGRKEEGFLGIVGVRYYGSSDAGWEEALADAQARTVTTGPHKGHGSYRGWTNAIKGLSK